MQSIKLKSAQEHGLLGVEQLEVQASFHKQVWPPSLKALQLISQKSPVEDRQKNV